MMLRSESKCVRIIVVYRPPPSKENKLTVAMFFEEFPVLLEQLAIAPNELIMMGDFNFHMEDMNDYDARRFSNLLNSFSLTQHVTGPTHKEGHTIDLVITRSSEDIIRDLYVTNPVISDHSAIHFKITVPKPGCQRKDVVFRKLRSIDKAQFASDIATSNLLNAPAGTLHELVDQYNQNLSSNR